MITLNGELPSDFMQSTFWELKIGEILLLLLCFIVWKPLTTVVQCAWVKKLKVLKAIKKS